MIMAPALRARTWISAYHRLLPFHARRSLALSAALAAIAAATPPPYLGGNSRSTAVIDAATPPGVLTSDALMVTARTRALFYGGYMVREENILNVFIRDCFIGQRRQRDLESIMRLARVQHRQRVCSSASRKRSCWLSRSQWSPELRHAATLITSSSCFWGMFFAIIRQKR